MSDAPRPRRAGRPCLSAARHCIAAAGDELARAHRRPLASSHPAPPPAFLQLTRPPSTPPSAHSLYGARAAVRAAAALLDSGSPVARSACANAKRVATDLGFSVCDRALQLHGGYGYLQDYALERLVRDTRVHRILEGTNQIMRVILSRALLE